VNVERGLSTLVSACEWYQPQADPPLSTAPAPVANKELIVHVTNED